MGKPRRLWFGDWRGDEEPALPQSDPEDTFVITQDHEEDAALVARRRKARRTTGAVLAAIALLCAIGFALSSGGGDKQLSADQSQAPPAQAPQAQTPQAQPQVPQAQVPQGGFGGADLTGPEAARAAAAALAQYPGQVERVTRGPGGSGYIVHVFQVEGGDEVHVAVDDQFKVEGSDAGRPPAGIGIAPGTSQ